MSKQPPQNAAPICDRVGCENPITGYDAWGQWCDDHNGGRSAAESCDVVGYVDRLGYLYCDACHDGDGCTPVLSGQPPHDGELCECCHRPLLRSPEAVTSEDAHPDREPVS